MDKIKVAVCDDTPFICEHISSFIAKNFTECSIVGNFPDGEDIIEYIKLKPVDLIITDIKMKKVSGLDVAEYIYKNELATKVIIITAFQEFEYAKKAINYSVSEFLCKPINLKELKSAVSNSIKLIRQFRENEIERSDKILDIYGRNYSFLISRLFADNLSGINSHATFSTPKLKNYSAFVFFYYSSSEKIDEADLKDLTAFYSEDYDAYLVRSASGEFTVMLSYDEPETDFSAYIESVCKGLLLLYRTESDHLLVKAGKFSYISELINSKSFNEQFKTPNARNFEMLSSHIARIEESFEYDKYYVYVLLMIIFLFDKVNKVSTKSYISALLRSSTKEKISYITDSFIINILKYNKSEDTLKADVENYIISHIPDPELGLVKIASHFLYSSEYFYRWFKKNFNVNFHQYITNLRIEKAKKMLECGGNIKDIPTIIGFKTSDHFTKTFKKATGLTPRDYVRNRKGDN